ncbi:MAG: hypothetical protein ACOCUR_00775 [Nanoarchaeota archaeon]
MKLAFRSHKTKVIIISFFSGVLLVSLLFFIISGTLSLNIDSSLPSSDDQSSLSCSNLGITEGEVHIDSENKTICICDSGVLDCNPGNMADVADSELDKYYENINYSCTSDSDCTIKDIHNCCGYFPSCVSRDSKTSPEKVKLLCELSERNAVCGFPSINSCVCNNGVCDGTI